jgi:hypothetical protein
MAGWRALDKATGEVVLVEPHGTHEEFVALLIKRYGEDLVYGTEAFPARFTIEPVEAWD